MHPPRGGFWAKGLLAPLVPTQLAFSASVCSSRILPGLLPLASRLPPTNTGHPDLSCVSWSGLLHFCPWDPCSWCPSGSGGSRSIVPTVGRAEGSTKPGRGPALPPGAAVPQILIK